MRATLLWYNLIFIELAYPTKETPVLLLLDGYFIHRQKIDLIDWEKRIMFAKQLKQKSMSLE